MAVVRVDDLRRRLEHDKVVSMRSGAGATGWQTADTYKFKNNGRTKMLAVKSSATSIDLTVKTPRKTQGTPSLDIPDYVKTLDAIEMRVIGPFEPSVYNDANGDVEFDVEAGTGLSMALISE